MDVIGNAIEIMNEKGIKFIRLQFVDINGIPKSVSVPFGSDEDLEDMFNDGILFDGSSVDGFVEINDSDLIMKPDPNTVSLLPWRPEESGVCRFICDIYNTDNTPFEGDPRSILKKSLKKISDEGYNYNIGPEPEFFIIDKDEEGNYIPHDDASYFDVEPLDKGPNFRRKLVFDLEELGFEVEASHHEVAPGQNEIAFKFDDALKTADAVITFKQAIKAIVDNMGYMVTFMPKPFFGVNGSGMHCHQSLFKNGENLFSDENSENGLSQEALYFMGGLLKHSAALSAVVAPTVNSYKRLVPGYEAPVYVAYGLKNRSALIRIPAARGKGTRIEYRCPDPSCNPYLAFAAMLEAGLDGINNKIDPGDPTEINIYKLNDEELEERGIKTLPASLWEAYHAFEEDEVLKKGLGSHISEKFLESKYAEWDEYRIQVFGYEQKKYMSL
ncbi:MAG: type I glutamate--ammonia ligase [Methanobrevibacter arboriphilus]|jgi:glutamine synthetase|uniref:Glutamine synthetase n=2 Tax=Methanobrevibacter arboriphilus TaxID=39441 RepID=A0ACA8R680_METAZ|nr:type I glutamate--ammonia ligase [Methanobrevibacter arboriphilus]MBF4468938.1 type I glutamate--ammonia ligase [Methanobrevibacter arboriphilus]MCC7561467.1 type I glutamate--ammonia ligase [Methanobrevibacter arboriphilus]BBL62333.1 glutamine synthetase [Methanobrevibacter arboriphilus]GLI11527.1 glutamine synthetase [Methanobrevibacter arboriphilus]